MEVVDHANDLWSFCTTEEIISYYLSQPTDPNRVSLFYAHGIMDPQIQEILASDWFTELRFSSGSYNPHSFSIVDHFTDEESSRYRVLFLLETLRSQLQLFDSRTVLANATSGNGFDPFNHPSVSGIDALRKPLFKLSAEKLHLLMRDKKIGTESFALYRSIDNFYDAQEAKFKALGALSSRTDRHLWFVWTEHIPQSGITIRLILRHMVDSAPEIIVTVEHTLDNEDKKVIEEFDSQFNCDFNDLPIQDDAIAPEAAHRTVNLCLTVDDDDTSERLYTMPTAPEAESLADIIQGFAVCFPQYSGLTEFRTPDGAPIADDAAVRLNAVFVHIVADNELPQPVADHRVVPPVFPRAQFQVANGIYKAVCDQLHTDGKTIEQYKRMSCVVMVPKFNSLKQQTEERIQACADLARQGGGDGGGDFTVAVELYPNASASTSARMSTLLQEIRQSAEDSDKLYVFIVDECHYAPSPTAILALHDPAIRAMRNVIVVLVSATPYNCLSTRSRIPESNIIEWGSLIDPNDTPNYIGFERYFRSVAFSLPVAHFEVFLGGSPVGIVLNEFREYADVEALAADISMRLRVLRDAGVFLSCVCDEESRFVFKISYVPRLPVFIPACDFLKRLGFQGDITFPKGVKEVTAQDPHTISDDITLVSQHLREDSHFRALFDKIEAGCKILSRPNAKKKEKLSAHWTGLSTGSGKVKVPLKYQLMTAKNGFTILLDYILSLAYYGSCRVAPLHADVTTFHLLPLAANAIPAITDAICDTFLFMVEECCYFDHYDPKSPMSCNIGDALNVALEMLYLSAHKEMNPQGGALDRRECLRYILFEKMKGEATHDTTTASESWYTETDRIVRMLIGEREPAPMVLMRVYDNDENRSMQILLRHALATCGLVIPRQGRSTVPAFSVISDISDTSLLKEIEPYFRDEYNVAEDGGIMHVKDIPSLRKNATNDGGRANLDLKYEDLLNIPCLIILCEKGRMGDTFPHTLRMLDLRVRTGGTASCFLQEIGRMCRYPRTADVAHVENAQEMEAYIAESPHGVTVSAANTNQFLGVATSRAKVMTILEGANPATQLPVLLARLVHPLPCALIHPDVMAAVRDAINKREVAITTVDVPPPPQSRREAEQLRARTRIIKFLKMDRGIDSYLSCRMMKEPLQYKLKDNGGHYDRENAAPERNPRRFLLSAECQVGKTGAYLHFLSLMRNTIDGSGDVQPPPPSPPAIPLSRPWHRWLIPTLSDLAKQRHFLYDYPKKGKYHRCIAQQRLAQLQSLIASHPEHGDIASFAQRFAEAIQSSERTITERGLQRLAMLPQIGPINGTSGEDILAFLNWDGRYLYDGVRHRCVDELLASFQQWLGTHQIGDNVEVPLAQTVMFGEHLSATALQDAEDEDAELGVDDADDADAALQQDGRAVPRIAGGHATFQGCAKAVASYQRSARMVPANKSVSITLDNFWGGTAQLDQSRNLHISPHDVVLSIPIEALQPHTQLSQRASTLPLGTTLGSLLREPGVIKRWIFTPSFCGTSSVGPQDKLLMRDDAFAVHNNTDGDLERLVRWRDFGEVLVVRSSQLALYRQYYGGTHIIAAMPDSMQYSDSDRQEGDSSILEMSAAEHGCGYSRRFSQLLASYLGMQCIWMIDDYVLKCWKLVCKEQYSTNKNVTVQPATFAEVMLHIESLFSDNTASTSPYPDIAARTQELLDSAHQADMPSYSSVSARLREVVGQLDKYGVVGMWRGSQWRCKVANPIKKSYSVYSFFLLNVEDTVRRQLFFPARPIWEDIEFNNLLDENGMQVCKLQVFAHEKKIHSSATVQQPSTLLGLLRREGYKLSNRPDRFEQIMLLPEDNSLLTELAEELTSAPANQETTTFLTLAHNASAFQRGAFAKKSRSCSLQSCLDSVIGESALLEQAITICEKPANALVTWLVLFPRLEHITDLKLPLREDEDPSRSVRVSYEYLPDSLVAESIIVVKATVTFLLVLRGLDALEIGGSKKINSPAQTTKAPSPGKHKLGRDPSAAKESPIAKNRVNGEQGRWINDHSAELLQQYDAQFSDIIDSYSSNKFTDCGGFRVPKVILNADYAPMLNDLCKEIPNNVANFGQRLRSAISERLKENVFASGVAEVNSLGPNKLAVQELYDRCRKKHAKKKLSSVTEDVADDEDGGSRGGKDGDGENGGESGDDSTGSPNKRSRTA